MFLICSEGVQNWFEIGNGMIKTGNWIISPTSAYGQKTYFTKGFSYVPRGSKIIFKTGNGIISPTSRPLIKKFLLQNVSHLIQGAQN